jgi:hypothetical protein
MLVHNDNLQQSNWPIFADFCVFAYKILFNHFWNIFYCFIYCVCLILVNATFFKIVYHTKAEYEKISKTAAAYQAAQKQLFSDDQETADSR